MDRLYELPFSRRPHPSAPDIPAYSMIKDSITIVRGCSGNCSFCAISRHQGPAVTSRSVGSIVKEARSLAEGDNFGGTISDLGGPTANLYGTSCAIGSCSRHDCLYPKVCKNLLIDEGRFIEMLDKVGAVENVKQVYISSGLRMELLRKTPELMQKLIDKHIPGSLKIAPEHTETEVLRLMHKEPHSQLVAFLETFKNMSRKGDRNPSNYSVYHQRSSRLHEGAHCKVGAEIENAGNYHQAVPGFHPDAGNNFNSNVCQQDSPGHGQTHRGCRQSA